MSLTKKWRIRRRMPSHLSNKATMTRAEFREALAQNFDGANEEFLRDLDEFAGRATQVAWGAWFGRLDGGPTCGCPAASIATLAPDHVLIPTADNAEYACGSGPSNWDRFMEKRTGGRRGILTITD